MATATGDARPSSSPASRAAMADATQTFACQPGYALDRELLPELEAAVAFLQDEVAQLRLGKRDDLAQLQELIEGPPLPGDRFQTLLSIWKVPGVPQELAELLKQLQQAQQREADVEKRVPKPREVIDVDAATEEEKQAVVEISSDSGDDGEDKKTGGEAMGEAGDARSPGIGATAAGDDDDSADDQDIDPDMRALFSLATAGAMAGNIAASSNEEEEEEEEGFSTVQEGSPAADAVRMNEAERQQAALQRLKALRKSMLLDVLSKIISVAKSKGVDPAMASTQAAGADEDSRVKDLEAISADVQSGAISEWEVFAQQVYLFCQHAISDAEEREQREAKQKGAELLHFARTLTETLRKASVQKEESLVQEIASASRAAAATVLSPRSEDAQTTHAAPETEAVQDEEQGDDSSEPRGVAESDKKAVKTPPPVHAHASPSSKRPSMVEVLTPNRISARIRQRGSSFSDLTSPQGHTPRNDESSSHAAGGEVETRGRKRPRAASNASSSATATPPPTAAGAIAVNTASEDDNMSESESQVSASEAESQKRRGSTRARGETASASSSAQTTPVKRAKTRKRRPILPATRMSSRQQKRRALRAKAAATDSTGAAGGDDEDEDGKDGESGTNNEGEDDTAQGEDEDEDPHQTNANSDATGEAGAASPPPVLLTKSGRPRKKPGRKPATWKSKADAK